MTTTMSRRPGDGQPSAPRPSGKSGGLRGLHDAARDSMDSRPGLDYLMLRITVLALVGIGLLMAYSASMASSWVETESGNVWSQAIRQTIMVVAGLFVFWLGLKIPPRLIKTLVPWLIAAALIALVAVLTPLGTGREEVGSQSWLYLGPFSIQPSEIARVAIGLYGANLLANELPHWGRLRTAMDIIRDPYVRYIAVAGLFMLLILAQGDVGMAASFGVVVAFTLFFAGLNLGVFFFGLIAVAVAGSLVFLTGGGFRSNRITTFLSALTGHIADTQGTGFQTYQGFLSLADGGAAGVGLGQSRAKWFYLPEARNDFVFAIVGEELGLWGAVLVVVLFATLGFFGIRTAMRAQNQFQALVAATLTAGVVSQAFFNVSYVIGLLPVTGVQLPMISAGGTATIITIGSMGLLCNVARHEPENISAVQNYGRPLFDRVFFIQEPEPEGAAPVRNGGRRRADGTGRSASAASRPTHAQRPTRGGRPAREDAARARFGEPVTVRRPRSTAPESTERSVRPAAGQFRPGRHESTDRRGSVDPRRRAGTDRGRHEGGSGRRRSDWR
ncbi:FtsW/RodA/SpoVE family cell cycle protein [uncultured Corynebacterium sp.]|uniref:FtsW/RodA/SpoVE family cell cycle protein n=1 Tax=uncultured Corynebacterium sp. TaxID=159447 RepID=UPI0025D358B9|nr:FtsW/RodA/SpoVE family cell cycle protein [uncultured Corynebacterium sp.]